MRERRKLLTVLECSTPTVWEVLSARADVISDAERLQQAHDLDADQPVAGSETGPSHLTALATLAQKQTEQTDISSAALAAHPSRQSHAHIKEHIVTCDIQALIASYVHVFQGGHCIGCPSPLLLLLHCTLLGSLIGRVISGQLLCVA